VRGVAAARRFSSGRGVSRAAFLRASQYALLVTGFGLVGYCAFALTEARVYQGNEERAFEEMTRITPQSFSKRAARHIQHAVLGRIAIPQVGISAMIAEGDDHHTLMRAVGHIPGTAMPGQSGNAVLAAHRDTFFRPLRKIRKGDAIELTTWSGSYRYRVESIQVVGPKDIRVLEPTKQSQLTLVTCYPFYFVGSAPKRFIVRAGLIPG
jgi:sortase A